MPPGVKHANGLIERLAALHQRMPLRRIRQARYDASEETEHSQPLHEVETRNTENTDERSDQSWTNEISLSSYTDKQCQPKHGECGLRENAQRNVHEHGARRDWYRGPIDRSQPRPDDVSADRGGGNKCADRLTDPTHPKQLAQRQAIGFWKKNPPRNCVEDDWHGEVINHHRGNSPARGSEGGGNLGRALPDEQD